MEKTTMSSLTYQNSGVDIEQGNKLVEAIKPIAKSTATKGVLAGIGGFAAMFELPLKQYQNPILVSATDGVGSKLKVAQMLNKHDTIGIDLVAMCVNDLLVQGAKPLFFLDYYATGKLDINLAKNVIKGIGDGCKQSNMALIGGESAEMPGMYNGTDYDLAGFCVGIVEKNKIIDGAKVSHGDSIIALPSSGPHSNGYSLIRKILERSKPNKTHLNALITPTKIYTKTVLNLIKKIDVHGFAHITGGGLLENIPRILPKQFCAKLNAAAWQIPPIFQWLQAQGNIDKQEMYRVFNCGIGMIIIVPKAQQKITLNQLKASGEAAFLVGEITQNKGTQIIID